MTGGLHIGTSGWTYDAWKADFYAGVPRARWLEHYATRFAAVEVNATFYHRLRPATFTGWRDRTPERFRFALKASRYLTHVSRLAPEPQAIEREREQSAALGDKLAVILWQLPANLHRALPRLAAFLRHLDGWSSVRHAIEFRHASWFDDETAALLQRHEVAACQSDAADWPMWDRLTTDLAYLRLHGHDTTYRSAYPEHALRAWAARIDAWRRQGKVVHAYFDNTDAGHAWRDALRLAALCSGLAPEQQA